MKGSHSKPDYSRQKYSRDFRQKKVFQRGRDAENWDVQCFHPNYQLLGVFIRKISAGLDSNSAAARIRQFLMDHTEIELPLLQPTHFTCVILLKLELFFYCLTELQHYFYSKNELLTPIGSAPIKRIVVCGTQFCQINEAPWLFHIYLDQCSWVAKNSKRPSNSLSNNPKSQTNKQTGIHLFICSYTHLNSLSMQQKDLLSIVLICMIN